MCVVAASDPAALEMRRTTSRSDATDEYFMVTSKGVVYTKYILHVSMLKFEVGNHLVALLGKDQYEKMKREFDDKNKWVVNEDGSISPKAAPHLAIGAEYDPVKRDPHQRMKREFPDKQRFIIHEDGSVSSKFTPQCFLGLQFEPSPVCAIYEDEEDGNGRAPTTQVRTHVGNVGFLHSLRDSVLTGDFDRRLNEVCRTLEACTLTPLTAHATLSLCACPITIAHLPRQK